MIIRLEYTPRRCFRGQRMIRPDADLTVGVSFRQLQRFSRRVFGTHSETPFVVFDTREFGWDWMHV